MQLANAEYKKVKKDNILKIHLFHAISYIYFIVQIY